MWSTAEGKTRLIYATGFVKKKSQATDEHYMYVSDINVRHILLPLINHTNKHYKVNERQHL